MRPQSMLSLTFGEDLRHLLLQNDGLQYVGTARNRQQIGGRGGGPSAAQDFR